MQMNVRDAARFLGVAESTVQRWARKREIPAHKLGDQYRFNRVELLEWASARNMPVAAEMLEDAMAPAAPLPTLAEAVQRGGVHYGIRGGDKPAILRAVVGVLPLADAGERDLLYRVLLAREALGSTGVGHGIAIPHPRNPIVLRVHEPIVALCFLESPVEFDAVDGKPVHTVCVVVSPSIRVHLHLLAVLATAMREDDVRQLLERRAPPGEIVAALQRADDEIARRRAERARAAGGDE